MTEQNTTLAPLRDQIESKLKRHLNKMYPGERAELEFETDFHGDTVKVVMVKGHRERTVESFRAEFRTVEFGRYDGFKYDRLTWTIDTVLRALGL